MEQQQQSLRYAAAINLHQLDNISKQFNETKWELVALLQRLIAVTGQHDHMLKLRQRRSIPDTSRATSQAIAKLDMARNHIETSLQELARLATAASELQTLVMADVGNIHSNAALNAYSRQIPAEAFNYEYREYQKAAEIIAQQAQVFRSEAQVKRIQYTNCSASNYDKLLLTWKATPAKDDEMDNLADLMLS